MSLHPQEIPEIPEQTVRVARAAFPSGNLCLKMRDECGAIFQDEQCADLFPPQGQPAEAPWRLALTTIFQFTEGLSDRFTEGLSERFTEGLSDRFTEGLSDRFTEGLSDRFTEGLCDRQVAEAVRGRIDWKDALSLELEDAGFDSSVRCEFRARLAGNGAEERLFEILLAHFREKGLLTFERRACSRLADGNAPIQRTFWERSGD